MDSILTSTKKLLGIAEEYRHFDSDILMHINSTLSVLNQLGVGDTPLVIQDEDDVWSDIIPDGLNLELVKSYMYMKVRLMFDPPSTASVLDSLNGLVAELEWRISSEMDMYSRNIVSNQNELL